MSCENTKPTSNLQCKRCGEDHGERVLVPENLRPVLANKPHAKFSVKSVNG